MLIRFNVLSAALLSFAMFCAEASAQDAAMPQPAGHVTPDQDASERADPADTSAQNSQDRAAAPAAGANAPAAPQTGPEAATQTAPAPAALGALAAAVKQAVESDVSKSTDEHTKIEGDTMAAFYHARAYAPLWVGESGPMQQANDIVAVLRDANAYGLEASDFAVPAFEAAGTDPAALATAEVRLTRAALLYARHARGGRITEPAEMLNSNLDRKPQLLDPRDVLAGLAASTPAAYLISTHPKHPQFEKLRQAFLTAGGGKAAAAAYDGKAASAAHDGKKALSAGAKRLRANMEEWRWMHDDMGELYVLNNIPEFMQYVYKDGKVIRKERIVAGMIDKQSSIFTRNLKYVVLRPKWRVPESIMVHELWPSLLKGGGLMRQYGLQIETKDGKVLDWRTIDWSKDDIRNYYVMQPPGGKSVLGVVKFSFPSQHTIFMHDTPDRWMFRQAQRTLSHGCLRVKNPVELAEIILGYDKGWDKARIAEFIRSGPFNNEVAMEKRIPIHLTYFTAWVEDDGKVRAFPDIYGHERRITQALDGDWDKINKGRNHLAPPQPNFNPKAVASSAPSRQKREARSTGDIISDMFGLSF